MAIKQVTITNLSTKAYAKAMVAEFLESGFDAAEVEVMEGMTEGAINTQLRNVIADQDLSEQVVCRKQGEQILLVKADLV